MLCLISNRRFGRRLRTSAMNKQPEVSNLFLVRVWVEEIGGGRSEWRGKVQHVVSGEARPFSDCAALEAAMHEMLEILQPEPGSGNAEGREGS
jgi:hypothetical protein